MGSDTPIAILLAMDLVLLLLTTVTMFLLPSDAKVTASPGENLLAPEQKKGKTGLVVKICIIVQMAFSFIYGAAYSVFFWKTQFDSWVCVLF